MTDKRTACLHQGQVLRDFRIHEITPLDTLHATAYQCEHISSGAKFIHIHCEDSENLFSINLPTPPPDNTGLPHIMEHAVLAGSQKYPVRDTLFELVKVSIGSFINAMTGWDCTYYPVASHVPADLFNMADVYFDSVFHPKLERATFKQEGFHFVPEDDAASGQDWTGRGIVFNEMLAAFSQPEEKLERLVMHELLPDTHYALESGGDPDAIPHLTYADFLDYYHTYYHPSNAYIVTYGNIPLQSHLEFLQPRLEPYAKKNIRFSVKRQSRWKTPVQIRESYAVGQNESLSEKTFHVLNWVVGDALDVKDYVMLELLSTLLIGNEAAPLKKELLDNNLGHDLFFSGFSNAGPESIFSLGIRGSDSDKDAPFRETALRTLESLATRRLDEELVENAFQQLAYRYREIKPMFPLELHQRILDSWIYDNQDPLNFIAPDRILTDCYNAYLENPDIFNQLIHQRLLDNPHRLQVIFEPDPEGQTRYDNHLNQQINEAASRHPAAELTEPPPEEETESTGPELPHLSLSQMPAEPLKLNFDESKRESGIKTIRTEISTNGVNYLTLAFDIQDLPYELWSYLPCYEQCVAKLGAAGENYEQTARRKAASTGGIRCTPDIHTRVDTENSPVWTLTFSLKALDEQIEEALDVLTDIVFEVNPNDKTRLQQVLFQGVEEYRSYFIQEGLRAATIQAGRAFSPESAVQDMIYGTSQYSLLKNAAEQFEQNRHDILENIEKIKGFFLSKNRLTVSYAGSERAEKQILEKINEWEKRLDNAPRQSASLRGATKPSTQMEGLVAPIQVSHCACVVPAPHVSSDAAAALEIAAHVLVLEYMVPKVRLEGNAYGAFCHYRGEESLLELSSYADPQAEETVSVFRNIRDYVHNLDLSIQETEQAVLGVLKDYLTHTRPSTAVREALFASLTGKSHDWLTNHYLKLMNTPPDEIKKTILETLEHGLPQAQFCLVSNRETLENTKSRHADFDWEITDILRPEQQGE